MLRAAEAIRKYSKNSGSCRIHSHRVLFFSLILPTAYKTKHFVVLKRDSFKDILQELMEAELDASLGYEKNQKGDVPTSNKRNGHSQIQELYGMELSAEMVSKITDRILPEVKEWQSRPLNPIYPFVFMDCIHYKVREDGRILSRAAYIVLGITADGYKDILSIAVGTNETSRFWLGMLNDLKNCGMQDLRKQSVRSILMRRSRDVSSICCAIPSNMSITAT